MFCIEPSEDYMGLHDMKPLAIGGGPIYLDQNKLSYARGYVHKDDPDDIPPLHTEEDESLLGRIWLAPSIIHFRAEDDALTRVD